MEEFVIVLITSNTCSACNRLLKIWPKIKIEIWKLNPSIKFVDNITIDQLNPKQNMIPKALLYMIKAIPMICFILKSEWTDLIKDPTNYKFKEIIPIFNMSNENNTIEKINYDKVFDAFNVTSYVSWTNAQTLRYKKPSQPQTPGISWNFPPKENNQVKPEIKSGLKLSSSRRLFPLVKYTL